jgi:hypothetical protein
MNGSWHNPSRQPPISSVAHLSFFHYFNLSPFLFNALATTLLKSPFDAAFLCDGGVPGETLTRWRLPLGGESVLSTRVRLEI